MKLRVLIAVLLLMLTAAIAQSTPKVVFSKLDHNCKPEAVPLLILGSFHFDNPGLDKYNAEVKDVLAPKKQEEIGDVLRRIAAFQPTKIAIEAPFKGSTTWPDRYKQYVQDEYTLGRNEIEQIGFRLAKQLGHKQLYPIDFNMWMDGRIPAEIGTAKRRPVDPNKRAKPAEEPPDFVKKKMQIVENGTVLEALRYMNREEEDRVDHAWYIDSLKPDPYSDALYGTTDPISNWYKRNLRMFTNVYRMAEPKDRILLIVGGGHRAILKQLAIDSGDFCAVDTAEYLK
jgi:hypothetical protein